jgi:serine/threonine protein kinase
MQFESGSAVGDYRLLFPLKQTEHAEVWAAKSADGSSAALVALKYLRGTGADDPAVVSLDEARAATALRHDGLVETFEVREEDGSVYVASALIQGPSLAALMQRLAREGRPLSAAITVYLGLKIAAALDYAASTASIDGLKVQLVHRHLSPHNVLIAGGGLVRLSDLGIAATDRTETPSGVVRGKVNYMAPEQLTGGRVSPASDVFALGVLLYESGSGHSLFGRDSTAQSMNAVLNQAPRPLPEIMPGFPESLWLVIKKAIAKDPEERYASVGAMYLALDQIASAVPGYAHAQEALAQFVTTLFPADAFAAKTPVPLVLGGTGDLMTDLAAETTKKHSIAPSPWPAVTNPDPLSARAMAERHSSSVPARPSSAVKTAARTTSGLGSAGIRSHSQPPAPLSFVGPSAELMDPYWDNFEPIISDPRTPKYAGALIGGLFVLWLLAQLFSTSSAAHEAQLGRLIQAGDQTAAASYLIENFDGFDNPRRALAQLTGAASVPELTPQPGPEPTPDADPEPTAELEPSRTLELAPPKPAERAAAAPDLPAVPIEAPSELPTGSRRAANFVKRGQRSLATGNLDSAAKAFQSCLQAQELALCHRQLGYIYQEQENRKLTVRHWERYVELVPKAEDAPLIREHIKRAMSVQ